VDRHPLQLVAREGCDWIVFSSSGRPVADVVKGKDPGNFAVYLVNPKDIKKGQVSVPVRVIHSARTIDGHVNHPVLSPDMASIVFTADLARRGLRRPHLPAALHALGQALQRHLLRQPP